MSERLRSYLHKLKFIASVKNPKIRANLLSECAADENFFKALREAVTNTLKNNVPMKVKEKKRLRRYKAS